MTTAFHLRPISRATNSSPTSSSSTASDHTPAMLPHSPQSNKLRRPLSPSSLKDLDLSANPNLLSRNYPAPPTGHELMALFPPAPPVNVLSGPTSGFFLAEERAFFAKGGNEMVRVRIEVDMPLETTNDAEKQHQKNHRELPKQWPPFSAVSSSSSSSPRSQTLSSPPQPQTSPILDRVPSSSHSSGGLAQPRRGPISVTTQPVYPIVSHTTITPQHQQPYPSHVRSPTETSPSSSSTPSFPIRNSAPQPQTQTTERRHSTHAHAETEEASPPDEAWRRPIPHNQRRRAGKHTKRVVVK
ncbi:hypothetical protein BC835DRAFT_1337232 [Cytidiella melzeri]|nr:hypothetical protein BC835DRAFT_1337232 [Cytidiella melzeri]